MTGVPPTSLVKTGPDGGAFGVAGGVDGAAGSMAAAGPVLEEAPPFTGLGAWRGHQDASGGQNFTSLVIQRKTIISNCNMLSRQLLDRCDLITARNTALPALPSRPTHLAWASWPQKPPSHPDNKHKPGSTPVPLTSMVDTLYVEKLAICELQRVSSTSRA